ncbi:hypothetical protein PMAYCL1PPCAC_22873, partial [Pristionchus mayeri]
SGDGGFVLFHAIISYSLLIISIFLNTLVFVVVRISRKIDGFRNVFYTYCVTNVLFSLLCSITLTQWVNSNNLAVYFPTGPFAANTFVTPIVFRSQSLIYMFVMSLVCSTFVYRYLKIIRPNTKELRSKVLSSLPFFPVTLWFIDLKLISLPDAKLR